MTAPFSDRLLGGATFLSPTGTGDFLVACSGLKRGDLPSSLPPLIGDKKVAAPARRLESRRLRVLPFAAIFSLFVTEPRG